MRVADLERALRQLGCFPGEVDLCVHVGYRLHQRCDPRADAGQVYRPAYVGHDVSTEPAGDTALHADIAGEREVFGKFATETRQSLFQIRERDRLQLEIAVDRQVGEVGFGSHGADAPLELEILLRRAEHRGLELDVDRTIEVDVLDLEVQLRGGEVDTFAGVDVMHLTVVDIDEGDGE